VKNEQEYKKEIDKILVEINILKDPFKACTAFNDSPVLTNEA
jgi:hypothetical protein